MATKTAYQTHSPTLQHCHVPACKSQNYRSPSSPCRAGDQKREHSVLGYRCAPESLCLPSADAADPGAVCSLQITVAFIYFFQPHTPTQSLHWHAAPTAAVLPVTASYPASEHPGLRGVVSGPGLTVGLDDHCGLFQP